MPVATRLSIENVDFNNRDEVDALMQQVMAAGRLLVQADIKKLQELGYIDSEGNSLCDELPEDMREGSERDFGG
jgi:hypothetical protein